MGKMIFNGEDAHPFAKFLKKDCMQLYDYEMFGGSKTVPIGIFSKIGSRTTYYNKERFN